MESLLGLPVAVQGKTFASAAKYIENLFKDREDSVSLNTKEVFMSRLRDAQENKKQQLEEEQQQQQLNVQNQMTYGGTANSYYGQNFQMNPNIETFSDTLTPDEQPWLYPNSELNAQNQMAWGGIEPVTPVTPITSSDTSVSFNDSSKFAADMSSIRVSADTPNSPTGSNQNWFKKNKMNILGGVGLAASAIAPMLANISARKSLNKPSTLKAQQLSPSMITPNFVNRQQIERNLANQAATSRYASKQVGASRNELLGSYGSIHGSTSSALANTMLQSDLADTNEKIRVQQGKLGIAELNQTQQSRVNEINAQNQAAYSNQMASYRQAMGANIGAIGTSLFNYMRANKYAKYAGQAAQFEALNNK